MSIVKFMMATTKADKRGKGKGEVSSAIADGKGKAVDAVPAWLADGREMIFIIDEVSLVSFNRRGIPVKGHLVRREEQDPAPVGEAPHWHHVIWSPGSIKDAP